MLFYWEKINLITIVSQLNSLFISDFLFIVECIIKISLSKFIFNCSRSEFKLKKIHNLTFGIKEYLTAKFKYNTSNINYKKTSYNSYYDIGYLNKICHQIIYKLRKVGAESKETYNRFNLLEIGILLYGPPGCGKTSIARVLSKELFCKFFYIKGPELLNKYVGESEKSIRILFDKARKSSPSIIFFDEMDSISNSRSLSLSSGNDRTLNQLLTEIDGLSLRKNLTIIGATNRIKIIDSALLRPGRLDKIFYIPFPTDKNKLSVLRSLSRIVTTGNCLDLFTFTEKTLFNLMSGADIRCLVSESCYEVRSNTLLKTFNCSYLIFSINNFKVIPIVKTFHFIKILILFSLFN